MYSVTACGPEPPALLAALAGDICQPDRGSWSALGLNMDLKVEAVREQAKDFPS